MKIIFFICTTVVLLLAQDIENSYKFKDTWFDVPGVFKAMNLLKDSHAAIIGLNDGYMTFRLGDALNKDGWLLALDYSEFVLKDMGSLLHKNYPNIALVKADSINLSLPDSTLDAVLIVKSYYKLGITDVFLQQVKKSLKKNGRFVIIEELHKRREYLSRDFQAKFSEISANFVTDDLIAAGFRIQSLKNPFVEVFPWSKGNWMIVATP
ncbi:MAG: class I SAM-dependent methyltransferase, partial [Calditrichaeota bacterium]|nr:class I SAM-dependent methyltransferase [Calditrichota bacterium]